MGYLCYSLRMAKTTKAKRKDRPVCADCQCYLAAPGVKDAGNGLCTSCNDNPGWHAPPTLKY
jgi:hypothetical protein